MLLCVIAHKLVPDKTKGCLKPFAKKVAKLKRPHGVRAFFKS